MRWFSGRQSEVLQPAIIPNTPAQRTVFMADNKALALYAIYKHRWDSWDDFIDNTPGTVVDPNTRGPIMTALPPGWLEFTGAAAGGQGETERNDLLLVAIRNGASPQELEYAERKADDRDVWDYQ
jgi:hypothetical protein